MDIILAVASVAACCQADAAPDRLLVAGMAIYTLVPPIQAEIGTGVMIELPQRPGVRVMAGLAVRPKPLPVYIVVLVTRVAVARRIGEHRGQMTFLTGSDRMQSNQRKACHVMIKSQLPRPAALVMATTTLFTQLSRMHVIRLVAVLALRAQILLIQLTAVACTAEQLIMLPTQRKVRFGIMIKNHFVPASGPVT